MNHTCVEIAFDYNISTTFSNNLGASIYYAFIWYQIGEEEDENENEEDERKRMKKRERKRWKRMRRRKRRRKRKRKRRRKRRWRRKKEEERKRSNPSFMGFCLACFYTSLVLYDSFIY